MLRSLVGSEMCIRDRTEGKPHERVYGAFGGRVDVDNVTLEQARLWGRLERYELTMQPGDCLFIPRGWVHHVSAPPANRSSSLLLWWYRQSRFSRQDCKEHGDRDSARTLHDCTWGYTPGENERPTSCKPNNLVGREEFRSGEL
eukprot:TRINITY_DN25017_c0_g2_i1.p1 TRINITY_DN25017_c0_g2~~TRINITY_DN25017_c0_g2_i1.p1  ORF type:complete len:144 (+),score=13.66 TRINITY_DN25017_c0_g2_i1:99-530(+)